MASAFDLRHGRNGEVEFGRGHAHQRQVVGIAKEHCRGAVDKGVERIGLFVIPGVNGFGGIGKVGKETHRVDAWQRADSSQRFRQLVKGRIAVVISHFSAVLHHQKRQDVGGAFDVAASAKADG